MEEEDMRTIFCGNLSEKVTEDVLYELFLQAGPLDSVRIPKGKDGRQRAFGFITYKHKSSVPYAMALFGGTELFQRELHMNSRNPERINMSEIQRGVGRDGFHSRSLSVPAGFGGNNEFPGGIVNFDTLQLLGQSLIKGLPQVNDLTQVAHAAYLSQMGMSQYLGGNNRFDSSLSARSLQGGWSSRNHPYAPSNAGSHHYGESNRHRRRR